MKFFLSIFLVFFIFSTPVTAEQKIVFVDMDRLVSVSKPGFSIFNQLKDINNKNLNFLKKEEKKLKDKEKKLLAQKNIISETDFKNKIDELKSEINSYNQNRNKMIKEFNKLKVENTNNLLKLIDPIITRYSAENKISELKSEINNYNQNRNEKIKKFNKLKIENTNNLLKLISPILAKYSTENEISIILQKKDLIIGKTELDITDEIIKIINNEIKEFKIE